MSISATVGHARDRLRFEVSALQEVRNIESRFQDLTYLDGTPRAAFDPGSGVIETFSASIGSFRIRSLRLNAFYRVFSPQRRILPYLGAGFGLSGLAVTDSFFESRFSCDATAACPPNLSYYDSWQDVDFTDISVSLFGYFGTEFRISDEFAAGLRLVINQSGKLYSETMYNEHPMPKLTANTEISDIMLTSVLATIRYSFGSIR